MKIVINSNCYYQKLEVPLGRLKCHIREVNGMSGTEEKSWFVTQSDKPEMRILKLALDCVTNHRLCCETQEMLRMVRA